MDTKSSGITIVPIKAGVGADIIGFDFSTLPPDHVKAVLEACSTYGVLRFRGYDQISDKQQITFSELFGEHMKHAEQMKGQPAAHDTYEEICIISNANDNNELPWHTDGWFEERPTKVTVLRAIQVPSAGGDTYFADMYKVYDALPADVRTDIEGRLIQCDTLYKAGGRLRLGQQPPKTDDIRQWQNVRHPIVRTHPVTGRKCVYIGAKTKGHWIVGLSLEKSALILSLIYDIVQRPEFQFRQVWQSGDLVIWDNACMMHRRAEGPEANDELRVMHRTTTQGERPYYLY
ncbi:hypothetical protein F4859DRAFT_378298 [Xylaria cf. heliscus]|nr:hypothetical protein F4859DRAFT_378298 [Xylaria cf. heliscus]